MRLRDQLSAIVDEMVSRGIHHRDAQQELEKCFIACALTRANGNVSQAAELIGIHRNTLSRKISEYRLKV